MGQVYRKSRVLWLINSFRNYHCGCGETELVCLEWYPHHKKIRNLVYRNSAKSKERQEAQKLMDDSTPVCRNCVARLENGVDLPFIL